MHPKRLVQEHENPFQQIKSQNRRNSPNNQDNQNTKKTNQDNPTKIKTIQQFKKSTIKQTVQPNPRSNNNQECPRFSKNQSKHQDDTDN